ncbi:MAG: Gldg family protein [Gammaproteobacteria bacterium]
MLLNRRTLFSSTGLFAIAALLIAINIVAGLVFKSARLDLTENKLYTLSQGTKNILASIDEPITLRFYFSEKLLVGAPQILNYGQRVGELLEEYATLARGKINLIVADPEPFSDHEDQAVQYGLQGVPVDTSGSLAYFGLIGSNATDNEEIIAFFQPNQEESLEYELTKLVYKLDHPEKKTLGLMSTLPISAGPGNPMMPAQDQAQDWFILSQLKQVFDVQQLEASIDSVPDNIDILMLVHPKGLEDKTLYAIDQFILNGGRAMIFVDPFAEADIPKMDQQNPMASFQAPKNSDLRRLFDVWGIELLDKKIATDRDAATRVTANQGGRAQQVDYIAWLSLNEKNFNSDDFVTRELKNIGLATAGILKKKEDASIEFTPLIETGKRTMLADVNQFQFGPNPMNLLRNFKSDNETLTLAARISGTVKTAFPNGLEADGDAADRQIMESKNPINVIVVADTDILRDQFWVNLQNFFGRTIALPRANNDAFLINAIENLSGSNDLISLRTRGKSVRPFDKVAEIKLEAEQQFRNKEKELQAKLAETERKLNELQQQKQDGESLILSAEQQRELEKFRAEQVQTRKALRNVQHELSKNIELLGSQLKFINIGLIPIIVILLATVLGIYRNKRLKTSLLANN